MTTIGRYEILDKLGTGSMGTVYRARDTVLDRPVALKIIRTGADVEPEIRERFYREARSCARLQHPSIVVVHDLGEVDRVAFIAMELLEGMDYRKVIDQRLDIPLTAKLGAMIQICEALAHAHKHGIVHRDIKPSNLLLLTNQKDVKVLDFGIARLPSSRLTVAGQILGTPNYMAPEQVLGKPTDPRADLFSAAVVFFEFLVYAHPFKSQTISQRIVKDQPDSLFQYDTRLPVLLERILNRGLAKDPAERYRTGEEFAADVRALLDALLHDASPTFSRVQLPSERDVRAYDPLPAPSAAGEPSLMAPVPPGEDKYEWYVSELLRLIPEFESAAARKDKVRAREILAKLNAIAAVDKRFFDAVEECRSTSEKLESAPDYRDTVIYEAPSPQGLVRPASGPGQPGPAAACVYCGAPNRIAAINCIKCGARMATGVAPQKEDLLPVSAPARNHAPGTGLPDKVGWEKEPKESKPAWSQEPRKPSESGGTGASASLLSSPGKPSQPQWLETTLRRLKGFPPLVLAVSGAVLLVLIGLILWALRPVPLEPAVAAAAVSGQTFLYKNTTSGSTIRSLNRGDHVNLLEMPHWRDQRWIPAQFAQGKKVTRPGYVRVSDLTEWNSSNPDSQLELIRMFQSGAKGSDTQIRSEIEALRRLAIACPGTRAAREANLLVAGLTLTLAQRMKTRGQPVIEWQSQIDLARAEIDAAGNDPSLRTGVDSLRRKIDEMTRDIAVVTPPPPPPNPLAKVAPQPPVQSRQKQIAALVSEARNDFAARRDDEAEKIVSYILKLDKGNQDALELQGRIARRREILAK